MKTVVEESSTLRVLVLRSNPIAPDPRVEKILLALTHAGYQPMALGWDRTGELPSSEVVHGVQVSRLPIQARFGSGMKNFPALLRWQIGLLSWLIRNRDKYDLIHACDFDTILPALYCKLGWKKKVVYDIFDFYADHLRRTPDWIKRCIRRVDTWVINRADAVILADDSRREQIQGSRPKRLEVIYNSPIDEEITDDAAERDAAHPRLRIAYVGLLQRERGLFEMLEVILRHPEWRLDLAGFGGDEEEIAAQARMTPNVRWHGRIDYRKALALSRQADVLFATYDPSIANHRYASPNKVFEAMMLARPIIVARGTNMDRMITDSNCGIVVEYGDTGALEAALLRLSREIDLREQLGRNGRRAYEETYGWPIMEQRLIHLYRSILASHQQAGDKIQAGGRTKA